MTSERTATFTSNQYSVVRSPRRSSPGASGRPGGADPEQRAERLPRHLYLEQRQPQPELFKRTVASNWAQLGSTYSSGPLAAGTQLQLRRPPARSPSATACSVYRSPTRLFRRGAGDHGLRHPRADNWSGGAAPSYTVGGTVSGLSGAVVLQDNGGDNLQRHR